MKNIENHCDYVQLLVRIVELISEIEKNAKDAESQYRRLTTQL